MTSNNKVISSSSSSSIQLHVIKGSNLEGSTLQKVVWMQMATAAKVPLSILSTAKVHNSIKDTALDQDPSNPFNLLDPNPRDPLPRAANMFLQLTTNSCEDMLKKRNVPIYE